MTFEEKQAAMEAAKKKATQNRSVERLAKPAV